MVGGDGIVLAGLFLSVLGDGEVVLAGFLRDAFLVDLALDIVWLHGCGMAGKARSTREGNRDKYSLPDGINAPYQRLGKAMSGRVTNDSVATSSARLCVGHKAP